MDLLQSLDTIVAIATPIGEGGIGVVRISGQKSFSILKRLCPSLKEGVEPRYVHHKQFSPYLSLSNKLKIDYKIINSQIQLIPFLLSLDKTKFLLSLTSNHYNTSALLIKHHINLSLKFFEIENHKRYKKFFGITYNGIQFNDASYRINLNEMNLYSDGNSVSDNNNLRNYLNLYVGLEFKKFIFSWHFTNILEEDYLIELDKNRDNFYMKYFTVKWKFDN